MFLPGDDDAGWGDSWASGDEQSKIPSRNRDGLDDVAVVVAVAAAVGVDVAAVAAANCCDEPKRREDRPVVTRIPAAANPAVPDGSGAAAPRSRNASKPSPIETRRFQRPFLIIGIQR